MNHVSLEACVNEKYVHETSTSLQLVQMIKLQVFELKHRMQKSCWRKGFAERKKNNHKEFMETKMI